MSSFTSAVVAAIGFFGALAVSKPTIDKLFGIEEEAIVPLVLVSQTDLDDLENRQSRLERRLRRLEKFLMQQEEIQSNATLAENSDQKLKDQCPKIASKVKHKEERQHLRKSNMKREREYCVEHNDNKENIPLCHQNRESRSNTTHLEVKKSKRCKCDVPLETAKKNALFEESAENKRVSNPAKRLASSPKGITSDALRNIKLRKVLFPQNVDGKSRDDFNLTPRTFTKKKVASRLGKKNFFHRLVMNDS